MRSDVVIYSHKCDEFKIMDILTAIDIVPSKVNGLPRSMYWLQDCIVILSIFIAYLASSIWFIGKNIYNLHTGRQEKYLNFEFTKVDSLIFFLDQLLH